MTSGVQPKQRSVIEPDQPAIEPDAPSPHSSASKARRWLLMGVVALTALAGTAIGFAVLDGRTQPVPPPLVITEAGAVIEERTFNTPIEVKANGITIRNVQITTLGDTVIKIAPDVRGTVVEDTVIRCRSEHAKGIAPGFYTATRIKVYGCERPFAYDDDNPAKITDSFADDKPVSGPASDASAATSAAASATPSASAPSAGPSARASQNAQRPPGAAGPVPTSWPNASTTGVPPGTALRASGGLTVTTAGQVLSGLNINGCVDVRAANVTIRRSKITCNGTYAIRTSDSTTNLVVEDVEIDGGGQTSATVCCGNYTLRRVNIYNTIDGPRLGSNSTIVDSYIHHLTRASGSHNDALQTTGAANIVVRHNTLEAYNPNTGDPFNAAIMIGSTTGPEVRNLLFEGNYCNGGNYTVGIRTDLTASGIRFRNNTFGTNYRYGVVAHYDHPGITWESNNIYLGTGRPVVTR